MNSIKLNSQLDLNGLCAYFSSVDLWTPLQTDDTSSCSPDVLQVCLERHLFPERLSSIAKSGGPCSLCYKPFLIVETRECTLLEDWLEAEMFMSLLVRLDRVQRRRCAYECVISFRNVTHPVLDPRPVYQLVKPLIAGFLDRHSCFKLSTVRLVLPAPPSRPALAGSAWKLEFGFSFDHMYPGNPPGFTGACLERGLCCAHLELPQGAILMPTASFREITTGCFKLAPIRSLRIITAEEQKQASEAKRKAETPLDIAFAARKPRLPHSPSDVTQGVAEMLVEMSKSQDDGRKD